MAEFEPVDNQTYSRIWGPASRVHEDDIWRAQQQIAEMYADVPQDLRPDPLELLAKHVQMQDRVVAAFPDAPPAFQEAMSDANVAAAPPSPDPLAPQTPGFDRAAEAMQQYERLRLLNAPSLNDPVTGQPREFWEQMDLEGIRTRPEGPDAIAGPADLTPEGYQYLESILRSEAPGMVYQGLPQSPHDFNPWVPTTQPPLQSPIVMDFVPPGRR